MKTLLGKKIGMTQIFTEEGLAVPVSVIEAGPEVVTQVKTVETDGYNAIQVGFENCFSPNHESNCFCFYSLETWTLMFSLGISSSTVNFVTHGVPSTL